MGETFETEFAIGQEVYLKQDIEAILRGDVRSRAVVTAIVVDLNSVKYRVASSLVRGDAMVGVGGEREYAITYCLDLLQKAFSWKQ